MPFGIKSISVRLEPQLGACRRSQVSGRITLDRPEGRNEVWVVTFGYKAALELFYAERTNAHDIRATKTY
jgi:hypothetical protein